MDASAAGTSTRSVINARLAERHPGEEGHAQERCVFVGASRATATEANAAGVFNGCVPHGEPGRIPKNSGRRRHGHRRLSEAGVSRAGCQAQMATWKGETVWGVRFDHHARKTRAMMRKGLMTGAPRRQVPRTTRRRQARTPHGGASAAPPPEASKPQNSAEHRWNRPACSFSGARSSRPVSTSRWNCTGVEHAGAFTPRRPRTPAAAMDASSTWRESCRPPDAFFVGVRAASGAPATPVPRACGPVLAQL